MERLTNETLENAIKVYETTVKAFQTCDDPEHITALDKVTIAFLKELKEYRTLEEQGRLLKLPCKLGATVYDIKWWDDKHEKVKVDGKTYFRTVRKHKVTKSTFGLFDIDLFGKEVFLTKAEAEAALEMMVE